MKEGAATRQGKYDVLLRQRESDPPQVLRAVAPVAHLRAS